MKAMSDKEFDKAFKSSFEDFEVEPTAKSWENILAQLDEKPKGKKFPIFWLSAAASVIIVLSIGISIYVKPTDDTIKLRAQEKPKDVVIENDFSSQAANKRDSNIGDNEVVVNDINKGSEEVNSSANNITQVKIAKNNPLEKNIIPDATINPKEDVLITNKVATITTDIKPIRRPTVTERMIADENLKNVTSINNQTTLARNTNDENLSNEGAQSDRKVKIKSVTDLVNFVVAKVDKREEKIIRVSKTEESDTEITGINLGLFKFRKGEK